MLTKLKQYSEQLLNRKNNEMMENVLMEDMLNQVDVCFVIDTTGSMGSFINIAKKQLSETLTKLSANQQIALQVGLVEYRDHPPQEKSFITRLYKLTGNFKRVQKNINQLSLGGGGDFPEAVYRGVYDACTKIKWREHSVRFIILVGDAPPHGFEQWSDMFLAKRVAVGSDYWRKSCPSGLSPQQVSAEAENRHITIYGVCMGAQPATKISFSTIAQLTGGTCVQSKGANDVIDLINDLLTKEFANVQFDKLVLETMEQKPDFDFAQLSVELNCSEHELIKSVNRLRKRGFLTSDELVSVES